MKTIISLFSFLFICNLSFSQTSWKPIASGLTSKDLSKIYFIDDNNGFIIGKEGTLLKTKDGGNSWNVLVVPAKHDFLTISFWKDKHGYINGLKTSDGGITWKIQSSTGNYRLLQCVKKDVMVGGSKNSFSGVVYKSNDAGANWSAVSKGFVSFYTASHFIDENVGYFTGWNSGNLIKTTDGGATWKKIKTVGSGSGLYGVHFANNKTGVVVGGGAYLKKTTDEGTNWTSIFPSKGDKANDYLRSVFALSEKEYFVVGEKTNTKSGLIYETIDGGTNWKLFSITKRLSDVKCTSKACFAIGENGLILKRAVKKKSTSIGSLDTSTFQHTIYPNPFSNRLNIEMKEGEYANAKLYNSMGQLVKQVSLTNKNQIDTSFLSSGIYFLEVEQNGQTSNYKVIKR